MGKLYHLQVHCADASIIQTATGTFLVDCDSVGDHAHLLPKNKRLRGVFITHQHHDHFSGLKYLKEEGYSIEWMIYSPYQRRNGDNSVELDEWNEFNSYIDYFKARGTQTRAPYKQDSFEKPYWQPDGIKFWMLGPSKPIADRETRELHDASLVFRADLGSRKCTFTGDASDPNLAEVAKIDHICDDILHASHHGSINGADLSFIKKCNAAYTVISTANGVHENVPHPTALQRYKDHTKQIVYRTDKDGTIMWDFQELSVKKPSAALVNKVTTVIQQQQAKQVIAAQIRQQQLLQQQQQQQNQNRWYWTWGGVSFGFRENNFLFTNSGTQAGRFDGTEIYGRDGRYVGEILEDRLITSLRKGNQLRSSFLPTWRLGRLNHLNHLGKLMRMGFRDFPSPEAFQR